MRRARGDRQREGGGEPDFPPLQAWRAAWEFAGAALHSPYGAALPLVLSVGVFLALIYAPILIDEAAAALLIYLLLSGAVVRLFLEFYRGLWRGDVAWMHKRPVLPLALLWSVALWVLTVSIFAPITFHLYDGGQGPFDVTSGIDVSSEDPETFRTTWRFALLYLWQAGNALPGSPMETLNIEAPVQYTSW